MLIPDHSFLSLIIAPLSVCVVVLYILALRRAIFRCSPHNRATSPDSVWLLLIPLFDLIWQFVLYPRISETLEREFRQRNLPIGTQPLRALGLALAILQVCSIIPIGHGILCIPGLLCGICYWVKISDYSNQLLAQPVSYPQPGYQQIVQAQPNPQSSGKFCVKCGTPMQITDVFCRFCGTQAL